MVEIIKYEFAEKGAEKTLDDLILRTAIKIHNAAVQRAPFKTGQLRNSIMWKTKKSDGKDEDGGFNANGGKSAPDQLEVTPKKGEGYVGSNLEHAIYQEFGTRKMPAQPFLRPAGESVAGSGANEIMNKYGRDAMEKEYQKRKMVKIK